MRAHGAGDESSAGAIRARRAGGGYDEAALSGLVDDADEAEVVRRQPDCRVEHVAEAGHSVQGDQPVALAELLTSFVDVR